MQRFGYRLCVQLEVFGALYLTISVAVLTEQTVYVSLQIVTRRR